MLKVLDRESFEEALIKLYTLLEFNKDHGVRGMLELWRFAAKLTPSFAKDMGPHRLGMNTAKDLQVSFHSCWTRHEMHAEPDIDKWRYAQLDVKLAVATTHMPASVV